jgi:hypothetical protein
MIRVRISVIRFCSTNSRDVLEGAQARRAQ